MLSDVILVISKFSNYLKKVMKKLNVLRCINLAVSDNIQTIEFSRIKCVQWNKLNEKLCCVFEICSRCLFHLSNVNYKSCMTK